MQFSRYEGNGGMIASWKHARDQRNIIESMLIDRKFVIDIFFYPVILFLDVYEGLRMKGEDRESTRSKEAKNTNNESFNSLTYCQYFRCDAL